MSLLTLSDLLAAYKTVSPDKEWALGGMENANKFANAIEAAVIARLATVSVEPVGYRSRLGSGSYTYCRTPEFFDNAEPLYTTEAIAAARVQAINEAAYEVREDPMYERAVRALIGERNEFHSNHKTD